MSTPAAPEDRPDTSLEEVLTEASQLIVDDDAESLAAWMKSHPTLAMTYADYVIEHLGIPEPDYLSDGSPEQGSIMRKVLYWARRMEVLDALKYAHYRGDNSERA